MNQKQKPSAALTFPLGERGKRKSNHRVWQCQCQAATESKKENRYARPRSLPTKSTAAAEAEQMYYYSRRQAAG
jgi:hypothetical protein